MTDTRERWALILGASSGMGEASARALAAAGDNICGIHLDFRAALQHVEELKADLTALGREVLYINMNAADDEKRAGALDQLEERFAAARAAGRDPYVHVVMHSLAFGSLVPFLTDDPKDGVDRKKMEMTQDVMANSLVYWVQDLHRRGLIGKGSRIYAMTSEGSTRVVPSYGVVSSAKAALESHVRQLAMELARRGTGATINAIRAGVTVTPALLKIPESQQMIDLTMKRNPTGRMTTPQDVANAIVALSGPGTDFISGDIISVDGSIAPLFAGWDRYNARIIEGLQGRSAEELDLRVGSSYWPVWAIAGHTAGARVFWLCGIFGEPGADRTPFPDPMNMLGWEDDPDHPRSASELVEAFESTWRVIASCLERWTVDMLLETFRRQTARGVQLHTRQSVLVRLLAHDAYHAGEIALIQGSHGSPQLDLWPPAPATPG